MPDGEMEAESRATDRLTLFSDAVVAIAITLLAIDLPVPEGGTVPLFWGIGPAQRRPLCGLSDQLLRDRRGVAGPSRHLQVRQAGQLPVADAQHLLAADDHAEPVRDEAAHGAGTPGPPDPRPAVQFLRAAAGAGVRDGVRH